MMTDNRVVALDVAAMRITLERLRQLHTPVAVCRGCCSTECPGLRLRRRVQRRTAHRLLALLHDPYDHKQNEPCLDEHTHGAEHDERQICATNTLLGVTPPAPTVIRQGPPMVVRTTLRPI